MFYSEMCLTGFSISLYSPKMNHHLRSDDVAKKISVSFLMFKIQTENKNKQTYLLWSTCSIQLCEMHTASTENLYAVAIHFISWFWICGLWNVWVIIQNLKRKFDHITASSKKGDISKRHYSLSQENVKSKPIQLST